MTIKATFPDGTVMLFGDSYRKWFDQLREFCLLHKKPRPGVVKCSAEWIGFGGLKWCAESHLVQALETEGKGRSVAEFSGWKVLNQIERRTLEKHVPDSQMNVRVLLRERLNRIWKEIEKLMAR